MAFDNQSLPTAQIRTLQAQGLDNNQIIQALQRDGYSMNQIFEAVNQVSGQPNTSPGTSVPRPPSQSSVPPSPFPSGSHPSSTNPSTEELVEAVIDEKWNELVKDITTIIEWKNQTQNTITSLRQQFVDLKDQFDKLHQALISKVGEYNKNILDVGAEVKAMEKVFSKVLPVFTENVAELSKITKNMKKK